MSWEDRIAVNPAILTGKPTIQGTRIAVEFVLELVAEGWSTDEIVRNYPGITAEDVRACVRYAVASLKNENVYPVTV